MLFTYSAKVPQQQTTSYCRQSEIFLDLLLESAGIAGIKVHRIITQSFLNSLSDHFIIESLKYDVEIRSTVSGFLIWKEKKCVNNEQKLYSMVETF